MAVAGLAGAPLLLGLILAVVPAILGRWGLLPTCLGANRAQYALLGLFCAG